MATVLGDVNYEKMAKWVIDGRKMSTKVHCGARQLQHVQSNKLKTAVTLYFQARRNTRGSTDIRHKRSHRIQLG